ncbi:MULTISPECIES: RrF2 family transcriptional regulator [Gemella]|jgi:transcriptional regulator, Rrf2 family|uniref:Transcriptional regulator, Rrf2 family n=1 Tax=Gemella haemolysans ATCC 10379 TaxID=546270 RepID=C5NX13_9BACL|nr:Rrf2 family transcriptional regulator [Gemella haemolysans]MDU6507036.1 Rrf2 family transcriptional regulator [Staphylococcus sp.]PMC47986.1 Rrf2 family transcriptional regulator [Streptococcus sp. UMB1385]TKW63645.1 MAG: Rrf2 family transcriptional regulator [Gemella sp.]EER68275.1 transcriptional regulator, Rrf2 family [Gemella haemolysans ATCC 10379]KAA8707434.1 Rrf2 family transcriptional regulator [Gemella haemolysans]
MHLTKSTEQAICIMVMLYLQDRHVFLNSKEISQRLNISPTYLKKIMRKLVVNDLVKANTGIGGGYKYKSNKKVTLYDVYVALNDEVEIFALKTDYVSKIFEGALAVDKRYSKYLKKVNTVNKAIKSSLEEITIENLVEDILEENSKIRLDWNNWEDEFERVNVFFKG